MAAIRTTNALFREDLGRLSQRALHLMPPSDGLSPQLVTLRRGLHLLHQRARTEFETSIYDPVLCLILQGRKDINFSGRTFRLAAGECALVSHDLPIVHRVREAPFLSLLFNIEIDVLHGLYEDVGQLATTKAQALEVHRADSRLLQALDRYLALTESETDGRVLGPLLLKEIHYRLLVAPFGHMLRSLIRHDSHARSIARAITLLRRDFRSPMVVDKLARAVGMSVSSFHKHFKAVTSSSPLQYQKELRLLEARRILTSGMASVTNAAFAVGYESPTQFSREYTRKFGRSPSKDMGAS